MHLQETNRIKILFYLDLLMDLLAHRMPMKTMKMRQLFKLETGDAVFHRPVGYMVNRDQCQRQFGLPAIWRLLAHGRVRLIFFPPLSKVTTLTPEQLDQLLSLDIRSPVLHHRRTWVTDYLITAYSTKSSVPHLSIFTGSNE